MPIFVLILVSAIALIAGLSVFFLRYLTEGRRLRAARAAIVLFDILGVGAMLFLFASHRTEGWAGMLALPIFLGCVAQIIALLLTMLAVLVRAAVRRMRGVPYSPARRRVLQCAALYPTAGALLGSYGAFIERTAAVRHDYRIPVRNLPSEAEGLVIAQISDVHLGAFFSVEEFDALLTETAAGGADLLAVTGDLFDAEHLNEAAAAVLEAHAEDFPRGIWYCIGNHEYFRRNALPIVTQMARRGRVHVLLNAAERVPGCGALYLAGTDYPFARGDAFYTEKAEFFAAAMEDVPVHAVTVLLAHHPEFIDDAAADGRVPLTLTGHTHGSQFGILGQPIFPVFKYTRGMVRIGENYGYVHTGNGSWFPLRIGCPPETAYFRLEQATYELD